MMPHGLSVPFLCLQMHPQLDPPYKGTQNPHYFSMSPKSETAGDSQRFHSLEMLNI